MATLAPGVEFVDRPIPPPRSASTATGVGFMTGLAERGPSEPVEVTSMLTFTERFGARVSYSVLSDAVETALAEGTARIYLSRVVGPAATAASLDLSDGTAATLRVSAVDVGEYGNALSVAVEVTGGDFVLVVSRAGVELERSPALADTTAAIAWALNSAHVRASELAGTGDPVASAAAPLAGGADDRTNATDASWAAALASFPRELGPGQVAAPGRTTAQAHTDLLAHCASHNRVALLDAPDTTQVATLRTSALAARSLVNARRGAMFAPWVDIRGLVAGTVRRVPYSAVQMGLIARVDALESANVAAAGVNGQSLTALGLGATWTDPERATLNDAGVTVARVIYGGVRTYGVRSLADPVDPTWLQLTHARFRMELQAVLEAAAESFVFAEFDGKGRKLAAFAGALAGELLPYHSAGSLYGDTPAEAFAIEVGPTVNPPAQLESGLVRAVVTVRMAPTGERVVIELSKRSIQEAI